VTGSARAGLAAALLALGGCAGVAGDAERGEVIRRVVPSTVQLRTDRAGGARRAASGVVLASESDRSWILTTRHFLEPTQPQQQVTLSTPRVKGRAVLRVSAISPDLDLALIELEGARLPAVSLKTASRLGDEVWVIGFPWGRRMTVVSGVVSQLAGEDGQVVVEGAVRMVDASVSYGTSGGGVFDARSGELLGIVESYRTARVALPERPDRVLQVPVPGETTVVSSDAIVRFLTAAGRAALVGR
jgi:serine protease Do